MEKSLQILLEIFRSNGFVRFLVSCIFFFAWMELLYSSRSLFVLSSIDFEGVVSKIVSLLVFFIPFILLIAIIQYKSKTSYLIAFGIFVYVFALKLFELNHLLNLYGNQNAEEGLLGMINQYSICIICEIETAIRLLIAFTAAICLMAKQSLLNDIKVQRLILLKVAIAIFVLRVLFYFI